MPEALAGLPRIVDMPAHERGLRRAARAVARVPFPRHGAKGEPRLPREVQERALTLEEDTFQELRALGQQELEEAARRALELARGARALAWERSLDGGTPEWARWLAEGVARMAAPEALIPGSGWKSPEGTAELAEAIWEGAGMDPQDVADRVVDAAKATAAAARVPLEDERLSLHRKGEGLCAWHDALLGCLAVWREAVGSAGLASGWDGRPGEGPMPDFAEAQALCRAGARLARAAGAGRLAERALAIEWHAIEMESEDSHQLEGMESLRQELLEILGEAEALHRDRERKARAAADEADAEQEGREAPEP